MPSVELAYRESKPGFFLGARHLTDRGIATLNDSHESDSENVSVTATEVTPHIKFKRLDKTARHIMQILDKEAVKEVLTHREIPEIKPGYIIQLRLEVPENKRRVSTVKGIVIARVQDITQVLTKCQKVLDKKKVRWAKLYYLRDKMNAVRK